MFVFKMKKYALKPDTSLSSNLKESKELHFAPKTVLGIS